MPKQKENVENIIKRAVEAGRISAERSARDAFKATEKRLYALPVLRVKIRDDKERLAKVLPGSARAGPGLPRMKSWRRSSQLWRPP